MIWQQTANVKVNFQQIFFIIRICVVFFLFSFAIFVVFWFFKLYFYSCYYYIAEKDHFQFPQCLFCRCQFKKCFFANKSEKCIRRSFRSLSKAISFIARKTTEYGTWTVDSQCTEHTYTTYLVHYVECGRERGA